MDGKEALQFLYKTFGKEAEEGQEMLSVANVLYEMGTGKMEDRNKAGDSNGSRQKIQYKAD